MDFRSTIEWVEVNPLVQDTGDTGYIRRRFFGWLSVCVMSTIMYGYPYTLVEYVWVMVAQTIAFLPFWLACKEGR